VFAGKRGIEAGEEITYGISSQNPSDLDYNFVWFEGAKEQKCYCGAENCRGFIGKRKAAPPPPKVDLKATRKGKSGKAEKSVTPKAKRVVDGKITKGAPKKVKAQIKNGKVVKATIITARKKATTIKSPVKTKVRKVMSIKSPTKAKAKVLKVVNGTKSPRETIRNSPAGKKAKAVAPQKTSMLGKRKRSESTVRSTKRKSTNTGTENSSNKSAPLSRKIAKPQSKKSSVSIPETNPPRFLYDSVSNPARKRNIH
jgi:histone-lysine N-methyltransferase ASH1L